MATSTSTVGINVNGIPKIKSEINTYKKKVLAVSAKLGAKKAVIHKAIQGDASVNSLIKAINSYEAYIKGLLNDLDTYSKYLDQLATAYKKQDSSNTSFKNFNQTQKYTVMEGAAEYKPSASDISGTLETADYNASVSDISTGVWDYSEAVPFDMELKDVTNNTEAVGELVEMAQQNVKK